MKARNVIDDGAARGFIVACLASAAILGWVSLTVNLERACALRESVAAAACAQTPAPGSGAESEMLRARIAKDPGDSNAWTSLALGDRSQAQPQLLAIASLLAPREPNLVLYRAASAFDRKDWAGAVPALIELGNNIDEVPLATGGLVQLVEAGEGRRLEPYLERGKPWLTRLLVHMRRARGSVAPALPLLVRAVHDGVLTETEARPYVRQLKESGEWSDAYALWLALHGPSLPALFNAGFDHAFEPDGFDWELPGANTRRAGVAAERVRTEQRGAVLDLQFNGKAITAPIVRQHLFLAPGRYRLRGEYAGRQFRSEGGLAWTAHCGPAPGARSQPLRDTDRLWASFEFEFVVAVDCLVTDLDLETGNASEAPLGARGRMSFDAFSLERVPP